MAAKIGDGDELALNHDISVTPFIDVILVLLIIFMVAAPLSTVDVPVELPSSNATPQPRPPKPLFATVRPDLSLAVRETTTARGALGPALQAATGGDHNQRIFVRADKVVPYGELMRVMNELRQVGYLKIALVGLEAVGR